MFTRPWQTAIVYDVPAEQGAGDVTPVETPPEGAVETTPVEGQVDTPPEGVVEAPAPVDWESRVRDEWGGEDTVAQAVAIHRALQTRDGVQALFQEAGRALGLGDDKLSALFGEPQPVASDGTQPLTAEQIIAEMQADPDRVVTASEVMTLMQHQETQRRAEAQAEQHITAVRSTIADTVKSLAIPADDVETVLTIGNQFLPVPGDITSATPEQIAHAVRKGYETFNARVEAHAQQRVQEKHDLHKDLPGTLPAGSGTGGEATPEPTSLDEAKRRTREMFKSVIAS